MLNSAVGEGIWQTNDGTITQSEKGCHIWWNEGTVYDTYAFTISFWNSRMELSMILWCLDFF